MRRLIFILMLLAPILAIAQDECKSIYPSYKNTLPLVLGNDRTISPTYCIVSPTLFLQQLQPFINWKRQQGFTVEVLEANNSYPDSIHKLLLERYHNATILHPLPSYILLVGDVNQIEAFSGRYYPSSDFSTHYTDLYYGDFSGDFFPESIVGRLPARDTTELRNMLNKTIDYEQQHFVEHIKRTLFVAGKESQSPAPITTNGQVNYLGQTLKHFSPSMDTFCFRNPSGENYLDSIINLLQSGVGFVNYTAHGVIDGWYAPSLSSDIIDTLHDSLPTLYINNCCLSGSFNNDCFGEHLLRKQQGGAVGFIGATNSALWNEDYYFCVGAKSPFSQHPAYDSLLLSPMDRLLHSHNEPIEQQAFTIGEMLRAGQMAVTQFGSPYLAFYWEIYNLLGDPSLMPLLGDLADIELLFPESLPWGTTQITISGTPYSYVSATQGDSLIGCTWIDSSGIATLSLKQSAMAEMLTLTTTSQFHRTRHDTIFIEPRNGHNAAFRQIDFQNGIIEIDLVGLNDNESTTLSLQQNGEDSTIGATISPFSTLCSPQVSHYTIPINIQQWGAHPIIAARLIISDPTGSSLTLPIAFDIAQSEPFLANLLLKQQGDTAVYLQRSQLVSAEALFVNPTIDSVVVSIEQTDAPNSPTCDTLAPHSSQLLVLDLSLDDTAHHLHLITSTRSRQNNTQKHHYYFIDPYTEQFEDGRLASLPWDNTTSLHPWTIDSTIHHSGNYSLRTGNIGARQNSDLALTIDMPHDDTLSFWVRSQSEENCDKLSFYIDGNRSVSWSGDLGWRKYKKLIPQGKHQLLWRYSKDDGGNYRDDCLWIDDLRIPFAHWDAPFGYFESPVGITTVRQNADNWKLYPNPASDFIHILYPQNATAIVYNSLGQIVAQQRLTTALNTINIESLTPGVYYLSIISQDKTSTRTFVKIKE